MSLDGEVRKVLAQLHTASAAAAESTRLLRDADLARGRMEDACTTLKVCTQALPVCLCVNVRLFACLCFSLYLSICQSFFVCQQGSAANYAQHHTEAAPGQCLMSLA